MPVLETGHFHRGFQLVDPLVAGDVIFVERSAIQPIRLTEEERRRYLQLPRGMSGDLRGWRRRSSNPARTPLERLSAINDYLSETCTYSLNVDNLRRSESFLDKFLFEEQKGYCVHFATAFTAIARMNGFPARYNEGFLINFPGSANETEVTGLSAHSWPEVWIDGAGWTRFEATPAVNPSQYANFFDEEELLSMYGFDMEMDSFTLRQVQSILGDRELDFDSGGGRGRCSRSRHRAWSPVQIAAAVGGASCSLALIVLAAGAPAADDRGWRTSCVR